VVDKKILEEKMQKVSLLINLTKGIGVVLIILNIIGIIYNKIEFTISLSLIVVIIFWLWALDSQVSRIETLLKKKGIMEDEDEK
jgi:hypothetical protein